MSRSHLHDTGQLARGGGVHPVRRALGEPRPLVRSAPSAIEALVERARVSPDDVLHVFVDPAGQFEVWRVERMVEQAGRVARRLADAGVKAGDRVFLGVAEPVDLVAAWHGCAWLGAAPLIYGRPLGRRRDGHWRREMLDLLDAVDPAAVLVDDDFAERATEHLQVTDAPWLRVREIETWPASEPPPLMASHPDRIAFYALTQGSSTGAPRPIGIEHGVLSQRIDDMVRIFEGRTTDLVCSWLPINPRTALLPAVMMPAIFAVPSVILDPMAFMFDPATWLRAMHAFRGTISSAPGRGYDVCARAVGADALEGLDLSSWRIALVGGEAIHAEHLDTFTRRMAPLGFTRSAFVATYGGAETLTMATCTAVGHEPVIDTVERDALVRTGRAEPSDGEKTSMTVVGRPMPGIEFRVVDTKGTEQPDRVLGEVQLRSAVMGRMLGAPKPDPSAWLTTGDAGYAIDGALVVCGRCTDLLRIDGRAVPAVIIEQALDRLVSIRWGCVVVDVAPPDAPSRPVVIFEHGVADRDTLARLSEQVESIFIELVGQPPTRVVPVRQQGLPRAPNGQLRRARVLTMLLVDALPPPLPGLRLIRR